MSKTNKTVETKRKIKTEKAITLIALIITVIVLLILAGVTINLTLGDNGIFKVAEQAARNYKDAEEKELGMLEDFTNTVDKHINNLQYVQLSSVAMPGDYVKYDGGNGYTGLWQVLYNDSKYGLQIISADVVSESDKCTLGGTTEAEAKESYNNAVDLLNAECRKYVNTAYAISGRCVGSNPINPEDKVTKTATLYFTHNDTTDSGCKEGDTEYETDYNAMEKATSQNVNGIHNINQYYWLASRRVYCDYSDAYFYVRIVDPASSDKAGMVDMLAISSNGNATPYRFSIYLRPVVKLFSDIKISNGDGSQANPYELIAK